MDTLNVRKQPWVRNSAVEQRYLVSRGNRRIHDVPAEEHRPTKNQQLHWHSAREDAHQ
jgi:hypothetical protein